MSEPRKPLRIRLRLSSRERQDPKVLLAALRAALLAHNVHLRVERRKEEPEPVPGAERDAAREHLEAAALRRVAAVLDDEAKKIAGTAPATTCRKAPNPKGVAGALKTLWNWMRGKLAAGWTFAAELVKEWAKKHI
jgi:hypothetical protein